MFEHAGHNNEIQLFSGCNQEGGLFLKCTTFICTDLFTSPECTILINMQKWKCVTLEGVSLY